MFNAERHTPVLNPQRVTELAEAVADGRTPDWRSAESSSSDLVERAIITKLRVVQSINGLYTSQRSSRGDEEGRVRLEPGDTWGGLEIRTQVGRGRFGDVYRAWDPALDRDVALKLVRHTEHQDNVEVRAVEEGRLMARVRHPNVVTIHGAQRIDGVSGLWMEFIEGRTLAAELAERGPFSAQQLTAVGLELCRALDAVHRAGLVHRDVKAQNVLRDETGRIVLGDFGTGQELDEPEDARGGLAGTPAYLAPEIFERKPGTPQSDIYSLGALLFHLATRAYPVPGRSLRELRDAHACRTRTTLAALRPDLPRSLTSVIDRALAFTPADRFADAQAMARALRPMQPHSGRRRRVMAAAALAAVVVAAGIVGMRERGRPSTPTLPFGERDWVLIAATENTSDNPVFDGALEAALERELSTSLFVNVVPRGRIVDTMRLMQQPATTPLDRATSREVAIRDGDVRAIVAGRIDPDGPQTYAVSVDLIAPSDGAIVASFAERTVAASAVTKAIRSMSFELRQQLGESLPAIDASRIELARVTTPSLRALQLYSQAMAMETDEGPPPDKRATMSVLLDEALREDPDFVSAHMKMSIIRRLQNRLPESLAHIERAVALGDRATELERLTSTAELHGVRAFMATDLTEFRRLQEHAAAVYEAVRRIRPDDHQALICLTNIYGIFLDRPNLEVASTLAALRPHSARWREATLQAALREGRLDVARQLATRDVPTLRDSDSARRAPWGGREAWLRNQPETALALADASSAELHFTPREFASNHARGVSDIYLALGALDKAESLLARVDDSFLRRFYGLRIAVERRDPVGLRRVLARDFATLEDVVPVSSTLIDAGLLVRAREALTVLKRRTGPAIKSRMLVEGQLLLAEGRTDEAIPILRTYLSAHTSVHDGVVRASLALARALVETGRPTEAIGLLEELSTRRVEFLAPVQFGGADWLAVRDALSQLYDRTGRVSDAVAVDAELQSLLAVADDDHPITRRVRQRAAARQAVSTRVDSSGPVARWHGSAVTAGTARARDLHAQSAGGSPADTAVVDDELARILSAADEDHPIRTRVTARRADSASSRR